MENGVIAESRGKLKASRYKLVHWLAVSLGLVLGFVRFGDGMQGIFTITNEEGWIGVITVASGTLTLLPFSIWGIFQPRRAAYALLGSVSISIIGSLYLMLVKRIRPQPLSEEIWFLLFLTVPFLIVALPLLYVGGGFRNKASANGTDSPGR